MSWYMNLIIWIKSKYSDYKWIFYTVQYILAISAITYLIVWAKALQGVDFKWPFLIVGICSIIIMRCFSILRLFGMLDKDVSTLRAISSQLMGISLGLVTPGKMGESYKVFSLGTDKTTTQKITLIFLVEKILDTGAILIFGMFFSLITGIHMREVFVLLAVLLFAMFFYVRLNHKLSLKGKRLFTASAIILTLFHYLAFSLSFWMVLFGAGIKISFFSSTLIITMANVIAIISTLPGGLGAREVTSTYLIASLAGVGNAFAGTIALAHTFLNYATTWAATILMVLFENKKWIKGTLRKTFKITISILR